MGGGTFVSSLSFEGCILAGLNRLSVGLVNVSQHLSNEFLMVKWIGLCGYVKCYVKWYLLSRPTRFHFIGNDDGV